MQIRAAVVFPVEAAAEVGLRSLTCCRQQRYKADMTGVLGVLTFIRRIAAEAVSNVLKNSGEPVGENSESL